MKHLLKLADLSTEEIYGILNLADQLKYERKNNIRENPLRIPSASFRAISTGS